MFILYNHIFYFFPLGPFYSCQPDLTAFCIYNISVLPRFLFTIFFPILQDIDIWIPGLSFHWSEGHTWLCSGLCEQGSLLVLLGGPYTKQLDTRQVPYCLSRSGLPFIPLILYFRLLSAHLYFQTSRPSFGSPFPIKLSSFLILSYSVIHHKLNFQTRF